jgi:saccharopine dehydrogenase-like NADP-dependent oxidoreductase
VGSIAAAAADLIAKRSEDAELCSPHQFRTRNDLNKRNERDRNQTKTQQNQRS